MAPKITIEDYHKLFIYDESSQTCLRWAIDCFSGRSNGRKHISVGDVAGSLNGTGGYSQIHYKQGMYRVHRIIWEMFHGYVPEKYVIDHIDGDPTNNSVSNLRAVEEKYNSRNKKKQNNNTSGFVGVTSIKYKNPANVEYRYYKASWADSVSLGKCYKIFSVHVHGEEEAFRLACEYRLKMIAQLNSQGAGYTDRHGL